MQKQRLEKQLRAEWSQRARAEDELRHAKSKLKAETKTVNAKIEDKFRKNFTTRQSQLRTQFQEETHRLTSQYTELKGFSLAIMTLVGKLERMVIAQDSKNKMWS